MDIIESKPIEVEIRGPLSSDEATRLLDYLHQEGELKKDSDRFFINFTDEAMRDKGLDVRVRITNNNTQLVAKTGKWLGEARKEVLLNLTEGQFPEAVKLLAMMGITKGIAGRRLIRDYILNDIIFSVVEVPGHSWFYEAEKMCSIGEDATCKEQIVHQLAKMGLKTFSEDEFVTYVEELDAKANVVFDSTIQQVESLELYPDIQVKQTNLSA